MSERVVIKNPETEAFDAEVRLLIDAAKGDAYLADLEEDEDK